MKIIFLLKNQKKIITRRFLFWFIKWATSFLFKNKDKSVVLLWRKSIVAISIFPFTLKMANFQDKHSFSSFAKIWLKYTTGPRSAAGNVSGYRCVSDCRSRGRKFDPGSVPYFRGDWSWNNFYGHSPPFRWFIQERLLSVTSKSMCTNYWLTACSSLPRKKCG